MINKPFTSSSKLNTPIFVNAPLTWLRCVFSNWEGLGKQRGLTQRLNSMNYSHVLKATKPHGHDCFDNYNQEYIILNQMVVTCVSYSLITHCLLHILVFSLKYIPSYLGSLNYLIFYKNNRIYSNLFWKKVI